MLKAQAVLGPVMTQFSSVGLRADYEYANL